jgi:hypothetical protein
MLVSTVFFYVEKPIKQRIPIWLKKPNAVLQVPVPGGGKLVKYIPSADQ